MPSPSPAGSEISSSVGITSQVHRGTLTSGQKAGQVGGEDTGWHLSPAGRVKGELASCGARSGLERVVVKNSLCRSLGEKKGLPDG